MKTPAEQLAEKIFLEHYNEIFSIDSDYSEEILISLLAKKHSIITLKHMYNTFKVKLYEDAIDVMKKM